MFVALISKGLFLMVFSAMAEVKSSSSFSYVISWARGLLHLIRIQSFAVFGASGNDVPFPNWWGNPDPDKLSVDRCKVFTNIPSPVSL